MDGSQLNTSTDAAASPAGRQPACHTQHQPDLQAGQGTGGVGDTSGEAGEGCCSGEDEVTGDADAGLLAQWGLLNMSNYESAQVRCWRCCA